VEIANVNIEVTELKGEEILFSNGYKLLPFETAPLEEIAPTKEEKKLIELELEALYIGEKIRFNDITTKNEIVIDEVLNELNSGDNVTIANEVKISSDSIVKIKSTDINIDEFYYNSMEFTLKPGQYREFTFVGYLSELSCNVEGDAELQIIDPLMNPVHLNDIERFTFNANYRIYSPTIRVTANKLSSIELYMDGIYFDKTGTKSRIQYLNEIYNDDGLPNAEPPVEKRILMNFNPSSNSFIGSNAIIDLVSGLYGIVYNSTTTFIDDRKFTRSTYINLGETLALNNQEPFTLSLWFNPISSYTNGQYSQILYKKDVVDIYINNNKLRVALGKNKVLFEYGNVFYDTWYNVTITYNEVNSLTVVYINGLPIGSSTDVGYSARNTDLLINYSDRYRKLGIDGYYGSLQLFNYHFSNGLVMSHVSDSNPSTKKKTNLVPGIRVNSYDTTRRGTRTPTDNYLFQILEKEYATSEYLINSEILSAVDYSLSTTPYETAMLTIIDGYIDIPETDYYIFQYEFNDAGQIFIDDILMAAVYPGSPNPSTFSTFLNKGTYRLKIRHYNAYYNYIYKLAIKKKSEPDTAYSVPNIYYEDINDTSSAPEDKSIVFHINKDNYSGITGDYTVTSEGIVCDSTTNYFDYDLQDTNLISNEKFTHSMWIKMLEEDWIRFLLNIGNSNSKVGKSTNLTLYYSEKIGALYIYHKKKRYETKINLNINEWYKIDLVVNKNQLVVYINAKPVLTLDGNKFDFSDQDNGLLVYGNDLDLNNPFNNIKTVFNDIKFYNIPLSLQEIQSNFNQEKSIYGV
jgi:hypothetical protein